MAKLILLTAAVALTHAKELTPETWEKETAGKTVMLRFFAPWCSHSKALKPKFDKLIAKYDGNPLITVADVDCEGAGKSLCEEQGVNGYPTVKWGVATMLDDYEGEHEDEPMTKFAEENLKPLCNPLNLEPCDSETKAIIEKYMKMSGKDLETEIEKYEKQHQEAEEEFDAAVEKMQEKYEELEKQKVEEQENIKNTGLTLMKSVRTHMYGAREPPPEKKEEL